MCPAMIEEVVGNAIIDREFQADLLNGKRAHVLARFSLTPEERQALLSIRAESLESFAGQIVGWLQSQHASARTWQAS